MRTETDTRREDLSRGLLGVLLAIVSLRVIVVTSPIVAWDLDATITPFVETSLGPASAVWLDMILIAISGLLLSIRGGARPLGWLAAASVLAPLLYHARISTGDGISPDDARIGSMWLASGWTGVAIARACRSPGSARLCAGVLVGICGMLAAKAAGQILFEHPLTVASFEESRDQFLASRGWAPGSTEAQLYERRLSQPDATGWFGLSNVLATAAGACAIGLGFAAWSSRHVRTTAIILAVASLASLAMLWFTRSKGGIAAAGAGAMLVAMLPMAGRVLRGGLSRERVRRIGGATLAISCVGVLVLVAVRGAMGERLDELSVLFRWFYLDTAMEVFSLHPVLGVGPAGFKSAYTLLKPAISPEEVTSAHCLPAELLAAFGLLGVSLLALFVRSIWGVGSGLIDKQSDEVASADEAGHADRAWLMIPLLATAAALIIERHMATPEGLLMRVAGLGVWIAAAWACSVAPARVPRLALGGAAVVAALHLMIEMTGSTDGAALWVAAVFGAAFGATAPEPGVKTVDTKKSRWPGLAGVVSAGVLAALVAIPLARWSGDLRSAAETVQPFAEFRVAGEDQAAAQRLAAAMGRRPTQTDPQGDWARLTSLASESLVDAAASAPGHLPTVRSAAVMLLAQGNLDEGRAVLAELSERRPNNPVVWMMLGRSLLAGGGDVPKAIAAFERAAELDPWGAAPQIALAEAYWARGEIELAADWALLAIRNDELQRLDPLRRLGQAQLARLEQLARGIVGPEGAADPGDGGTPKPGNP
ncbi:MAG: O-antigen ligase family protein [Planctomycetota bacterium]